MKKLNDLQCPQCGGVEKDVFAERVDGKVIKKGQEDQDVEAICQDCGQQLQLALVRFGIGSGMYGDANTATGHVHDVAKSIAENIIGMPLPVPMRHPITGGPAELFIQTAELVADHGCMKAFNCTAGVRMVIPPESLN